MYVNARARTLDLQDSWRADFGRNGQEPMPSFFILYSSAL